MTQSLNLSLAQSMTFRLILSLSLSPSLLESKKSVTFEVDCCWNLMFFHQVMVAGGLEPELLHSRWYSRPAEIGSFLFMIVTVSGRTEKSLRMMRILNRWPRIWLLISKWGLWLFFSNVSHLFKHVRQLKHVPHLIFSILLRILTIHFYGKLGLYK